MTGNCVSAQLTLSFAVEALRLLNEILSRLDIVADNGTEVLCAFPASHALHDRLCLFLADTENDEDEGLIEDCHRTAPKSVPPKTRLLAQVSRPALGCASGLASPGMIAGYTHAYPIHG